MPRSHGPSGRTHGPRLEGVSTNLAIDPDLDPIFPDNYWDGELPRQTLQLVNQLVVLVDQDFVEIDPSLAKHPLRLGAGGSTGHAVELHLRHAEPPGKVIS